MNDGSILHARARLDQALAGLDRSMANLDRQLERWLAAPRPADVALTRRHEALKAEVASVLAELDEMLGLPSTPPGGRSDG